MKTVFFTFLFIFHTVITFSQIPISTIEQLQKIGNDPGYPLDGEYYLTNDIDASDTKLWNEGKGFEPIGKRFTDDFTGIFDGKGFVISDLFISRSDENWVGLFRSGFNSEFLNINMNNVHISGNNSVGTLAGMCSYIINCHIKGEVMGIRGIGGITGEHGNFVNCSFMGMVQGEGIYIGGLTGAGGYIEDSYTSCTVIGDSNVGGLTGRNGLNDLIIRSYATGIVMGNEYVGGLAGINYGGIIDSYSNATVIGEASYIGGLIGLNHIYAENCYATGPVSGLNYVGGLIGHSLVEPYIGWPLVLESYYDLETTGYISPFMNTGDPKTTVEMMTPSTFTNWDFENVWFMVPGKSYPVLRPERYVGVKIEPISGTPNPKESLPVEFTISFEEPVRNFTFDDLDFSSSTLQGIQGTLKIEDEPTTFGVMDCFTTFTLTITDSATSYGLIAVRVPLGAAMNRANYPSAASKPAGIYILVEHLWGDLNGDLVVNNEDRDVLISMILDPMNGWKSIIPFPWCDLSNDKKLDIADIVILILNL